MKAIADQALSRTDVGFTKLIPTDEMSKDRYKTNAAFAIDGINSNFRKSTLFSLKLPSNDTGYSPRTFKTPKKGLNNLKTSMLKKS